MTIFLDTRYAWSAEGDIKYEGMNTHCNANVREKTWYVKKYTYDDDENIIRIQGPIKGSWDGREGLNWGS